MISRWIAVARLVPWALWSLAACAAAEGLRYAYRPVGELATFAIAAGAAFASGPAALPQLTLRSTALIPMPQGVPSAHASALAALDDGELLAFWWAGARESGGDVAIYTARWRNGHWSSARRIVEREQLSGQLGFGVRRLGNPTAWVARDGRVHLYAVATGAGGWAASRIVHLISSDRGRSFTVKRMLPLSPLFNTSVLVRSNPVALADGGWLLPAYFELGNKYPMLVAMDAQGEPLWSRRIGASTTSLQPALLATSATEIHALMRDQSAQQRIQQATSTDAGWNWQDNTALGLKNVDSSVAAIALLKGGFVMAHNDQLAQPATARQWLRLSTSSDAVSWREMQDVRRGALGDEFSYPSLVQIGRELHLSFTAKRGAIAHHVYDIAAGPLTP
ncbi:MAG: sialidase family protein [Burkholderiaceae bacterium]